MGVDRVANEKDRTSCRQNRDRRHFDLDDSGRSVAVMAADEAVGDAKHCWLDRPHSAERLIRMLSAFGFMAVTAMLVCYALEQRGARYVLAFAAACGLGSAYGFLQGAWPFGIVEAIWAGVALRRWARAVDG
jgi:hypothetical protein